MQQLATLERTLRKPTSATAPPGRSAVEPSTYMARHGVASLGTSYQPRMAPAMRPPTAEMPTANAFLRDTAPTSIDATERVVAAPTAATTGFAPKPVDVAPAIQVELDTVRTRETMPAPEVLEPMPEAEISIETSSEIQPVEAAEEGFEARNSEVAEGEV